MYLRFLACASIRIINGLSGMTRITRLGGEILFALTIVCSDSLNIYAYLLVQSIIVTHVYTYIFI